MSTLTIFRGLPGSGKSTAARKLGCLLIEADMYHYRNGTYAFSESKKHGAHGWCRYMVRSAMIVGVDVAVANTFTRKWEIEPYIEMAKDFNYKVEIVCCTAEYPSIHNVPAAVMDRMRSRFERIDGEKIYNSQDKK